MVSGGRDGKLMYWRLQDGLCLQTVEVAEITAGSSGHFTFFILFLCCLSSFEIMIDVV